MCDPTTMMVLSVGTSLMEYDEKAKQTQAQNTASVKDYHQKIKQTRLAQLQSQASMSDALFEDTIVAKQNQASAYARTEGMGGSLVNRIVRDQQAIEARNKDNVNQNYAMDIQQKQYEMQGYAVQSQGRMKAAPNFFTTGLEIADTYYKYDTAQKGVIT